MLPEEYTSSLSLLYTFFLCALFSGVVVSEGLPLYISRSLLPLAFLDDCDEFSPVWYYFVVVGVVLRRIFLFSSYEVPRNVCSNCGEV